MREVGDCERARQFVEKQADSMMRQMSQTPTTPPEGEPDQSRLISFSDNVLSVAITLLVFDVRVPAGWTHLELRDAIPALAPRILSFALSFFVIGVFWVAHNNIFRAATHINRAIQWLNNLYLLTICLIPASAALLGQFSGQRAAVVLYGVNLLAVGLSMRWLWGYVIRINLERGAPINAQLQRSGKRRIGVGIILALIAVACGWINPWVSYAIFWVTPLSFAWVQFR